MKNLRSIVVVLLVIGGGIYGFWSATFNQNPYYAPVGHELLVPESERHLAWKWRPSAVWLPSYVLCKTPYASIGISYTRSGYMFRSMAGRVFYFSASTIIGMIPGAVVGLAVRRRGR